MRARDYARNQIEKSESGPQIIEIKQIPPTMEEENYKNLKKWLSDFWSYGYNKMMERKNDTEGEQGLVKKNPFKEIDKTDVIGLFAEYSEENEIDLSVIPEAARLMDPDLFQMLAVTGRETEFSLVEELEKRYGQVPALKLAVRIIRHTYALWRTHSRIIEERTDEFDVNELRELRENALEMANYILPATHVTKDETMAGDIDLHGFIENSDWRGKDETDYEGNGVYVGIFGAYRDWSPGGKLYEFPLELKDAFPILVGGGERLAMANTLTEYIRVQDRSKGEALGVRQWWLRFDQASSDTDGGLLDWQKRILGELYGNDFNIRIDSEGFEVAVIDTDDPPIVLATIGKYLNLYRCMSESSWSRISGGAALSVK